VAQRSGDAPRVAQLAERRERCTGEALAFRQLTDAAHHVRVQPLGVRERARCVEPGVLGERRAAVCLRVVDAAFPDDERGVRGAGVGPCHRGHLAGDPLLGGPQRGRQ
jgi:hypothetical protein